MSEGLFRKASIDKVSSPEQLDLLMRVTSPVGWLALLTVGITLSLFGVWLVLGSIDDQVDGSGTFEVGVGLFDVQATMGGTIESLEVPDDTVVAVGQVVARLRNEARSPEERKAVEDGLSSADFDITASRSAQQRARAQLRSLQDELRDLERTVKNGLQPEIMLLQKQGQIRSVQSEIESYDSNVKTLEAKKTQLRARLNSTTDLTTTVAGKLRNLKQRGEQVSLGQAVVRIERATGADQQYCGGGMHVLAYVPIGTGARVARDQPVRVSPAGFKKEEFGFMLGRVAWRAPRQTSPEEIVAKLKNSQLASKFGADMYETRICLELDENKNPKWSSPRGQNQVIGVGGPTEVSVIVESKRPYTYIIPEMKKAVGL